MLAASVDYAFFGTETGLKQTVATAGDHGLNERWIPSVVGRSRGRPRKTFGSRVQDETEARLDCYDTEQRQVLAADKRRREFHEEKRNEFESYAEEVDDEQNESERSRESMEQWREFHYDGMNKPPPLYEYNLHTI
ncbi:LOW QUALITY PROTEIN: unique cartilage matrix-associated protein [Phycodurus eques]|uniref:LOW QUALITY PROTEIN: unique cartilage matrix-associated protein n=1 Tax=Phycodurus eques TaxID=693459 RepID=UPI002ACE3DF4|nr:LOW QUALITY PROTEIN: unique cartilage matrix-associated protein [Phycodurus eques]